MSDHARETEQVPPSSAPGARASGTRETLIDCSVCGWRHTVPCGRDDCPHDATTHFKTIADALDNAIANGCAEELSKMSAEDIAYDLARHDAGCERLPIEIVKAGVRAWQSPQRDDEPTTHKLTRAVNELKDAYDMLSKAATWPENDWQGLRYHALQTARTVKASLDELAASASSGEGGGTAQEELRVGTRVWLNEDVEQHNRIVVGTVKRVSPAGYVNVRWDDGTFPVSHFSPASATSRLKVVTGDDALPRHDWDCGKGQTDPPCRQCGVIQTDANEHEPCRPPVGASDPRGQEEPKQPNPCPVCGTFLWGDTRPCWNCAYRAMQAASPAPRRPEEEPTMEQHYERVRAASRGTAPAVPAASWSGNVKPENAMNVNFVAEQIRALADHWSDPEFWKDEGCRMDSRDCAEALRQVLAGSVVVTRGADPAVPESTRDEALALARDRQAITIFVGCG